MPIRLFHYGESYLNQLPVISSKSILTDLNSRSDHVNLEWKDFVLTGRTSMSRVNNLCQYVSLFGLIEAVYSQKITLH